MFVLSPLSQSSVGGNQRISIKITYMSKQAPQDLVWMSTSNLIRLICAVKYCLQAINEVNSSTGVLYEIASIQVISPLASAGIPAYWHPDDWIHTQPGG